MAIWEKFVDTEAVVPISRAVVTPAIRIEVGGKQIGYIQNFNETQNRPANPQYEVGTEGIVELIPAQPTYTATANKVAVYHYNMLKVFQDNGIKEKDSDKWSAIAAQLKAKGHNDDDVYTALVHAAIPFDIKVIETNPETGEEESTTYVDCFITSYSRPINAAGNLTVIETCNISFRDIVYNK